MRYVMIEEEEFKRAKEAIEAARVSMRLVKVCDGKQWDDGTRRSFQRVIDDLPTFDSVKLSDEVRP